MTGFRELHVWQKSKELAVEIYKITQEETFRRDYGFKDQIRKSQSSKPKAESNANGRL